MVDERVAKPMQHPQKFALHAGWAGEVSRLRLPLAPDDRPHDRPLIRRNCLRDLRQQPLPRLPKQHDSARWQLRLPVTKQIDHDPNRRFGIIAITCQVAGRS